MRYVVESLEDTKKIAIEFAHKIKKGDLIKFYGDLGAGKTTFLRIIAGILEPTSGTVTFDELNYHDNETEIKKNIAYLSGNTKIYNTLSCYELLHMCADIYGVENFSVNNTARIVLVIRVRFFRGETSQSRQSRQCASFANASALCPQRPALY